MNINQEIAISLLAAVSENGVIGHRNKMPWHIPEDVKHFKNLTMGHPVIMGRKTYQSILSYIGKNLQGRTSIVLTRSPLKDEDVIAVKDIETAISIAREIATVDGLKEIFVIGGAQIFKLALPFVNRIYLTKIHRAFEGDTWLPEIDWSQWQETRREEVESNPPFSFLRYERKS
jgi:dihydrofolate reductase